MIYKLIGSGDLENIVETILRNRGIEDPDSYLMLDESCCNKYSDLLHIDDAVKCFDEHFSKNDKISILIDCDCDGFSSAASIPELPIVPVWPAFRKKNAPEDHRSSAVQRNGTRLKSQTLSDFLDR
jgi:hypothetical protein